MKTEKEIQKHLQRALKLRARTAGTNTEGQARAVIEFTRIHDEQIILIVLTTLYL